MMDNTKEKHGGEDILQKAVLIAANPYRNYMISPGQISKEPGDVELHKSHLHQHGGVFWDVVPQGGSGKPWRYPEIKSGYFYIAREKAVRYWIDIEYVKRWKEVELAKVRDYIPSCRRAYLEAYPRAKNYYAILIRDIQRLSHERKKEDLQLVTSEKNVEQVRNYVIIVDPNWR